MNKKIVSFVLAMVLAVGLGSSSLFGTEFSVKTKDLYNQYGTGNIDTKQNDKDLDKDSDNADVENVKNVKDKTNQICAVFNYASGVVISMMDQDRTITLYNAGEAFLTLKYNEPKGNVGFGTYVVAGVTINGTSFDTVMKYGNLQNFLKALGVTQKQMECAEEKKDGEGDVYEDADSRVTVGWLAEAEDQLALGINHTISIDLTASGGATVALFTNGKQTSVVGYRGVEIQHYNYNLAGTLETISQLTYEIDDKKQKEKKVSVTEKAYYKETHTTVHMDEYGRQSYVTNSNGDVISSYVYSSNSSLFSIFDSKTNSTTYYSGGHAGFVINDKGFKIQEYFYHENGSLDGIKSYNYDEDKHKVVVTGIQAYRYGKYIGSASLPAEAGQPTTFDELRLTVDYAKLHPEKVIASLKEGAYKMKPGENELTIGGKKYVWNGSGWEDEDGKPIIEIKDDATADDIKKAKEKAAKATYEAENENKSWDDLSQSQKNARINKYAVIKKSQSKGKLTTKATELAKKVAKNTSPYGNIKNLGIYDADFNNDAFMALLKNSPDSNPPGFGFTQQNINRMKAWSNGYSMVGQLDLTIDAKAFKTNTDTTTNTKVVNKTVDTKVHNGKFNAYNTTKKGASTSYSTASKKTNGQVGQQISAKLMIMDHGAQRIQVQGKAITLRDSKDAAITKQVTATVTNEVTKHVDPAVEGEMWSSEPTEEELEAEMKERGISEDDEDAIEALKSELSEKKLKAKAKELGVDENDAQAMEDLKNGFYTGTDGQIYAIVDANSINIMDGSGFQAANGETVMVAVTKDMKDSILDNGSRHIMFMGDVRESAVNGYLTITANVNYGGAFVQGQKEVEVARDNLMLASLGAAISNGVDIREASAVLDDYNKRFGTSFTTQDATNKLNNLTKDEQWIINNTNENMKLFSQVLGKSQTDYKKGWNILLQQLAAIF